MGKEMIFFRDSCTRVKDLERENKELVKQGSIDKKTLIALREVRMELLTSIVLNGLSYLWVQCVIFELRWPTQPKPGYLIKHLLLWFIRCPNYKTYCQPPEMSSKPIQVSVDILMWRVFPQRNSFC